MDNRRFTEALRLKREVSLTSLVRQEIERSIEAGELAAGDWINEAMVAARLGVSRGPVREACRGLEQSGLVTVVVNRGAFVRAFDAKEALEIYGIRAALFGFAGFLLAPAITSAQLAALTELQASMQRAAVGEQLDAYYPLNLQFHAELVTQTGNARLARQYAAAVRELHLFRRRALVTPGRMRSSNAEHAAILLSLAAHDADGTRRLMENHVLAARDRVLSASAAAAAGAG
jgi:DNA-binding GntR family transcriptional regulator